MCTRLRQPVKRGSLRSESNSSSSKESRGMLAMDEVPTVSTAAEIGGAGHAFASPKVRPRVIHPSEMYHPQNRASDPRKTLKSKGIFYTGNMAASPSLATNIFQHSPCCFGPAGPENPRRFWSHGRHAAAVDACHLSVHFHHVSTWRFLALLTRARKFFEQRGRRSDAGTTDGVNS